MLAKLFAIGLLAGSFLSATASPLARSELGYYDPETKGGDMLADHDVLTHFGEPLNVCSRLINWASF